MSILRRFTNFVLQGRIQACAVAFLLAYIPIIGSASVLIAGLITLRKGALEGAFVFIAATIPYVLSYYSTYHTGVEINLALAAFVMFTTSSCLMWLFACLLKRYSSWGFVLDWAVLLGVVLIGTVHIVYPDIKNWWGEQLTGYLNKTTMIMQEIQPNAAMVPTPVQLRVVDALKVYATGLLFASTLFNALIQLMISRWWQAIMFNPGALRKELLNIRLSYVAGLLFLICYPLATQGRNEIALDIMPVMYLIFGIAGLSITHDLVAKKIGWLGLVFLYVSLVGFVIYPGGLVIAAVIFSIIGFFDIGIDFRKRFAG
jgi:hypothetical protein